MPNIKPISDLRNYASVLETVKVGKPLYLTKNGRGCYTVMNIDEQEEQREKAEKYEGFRIPEKDRDSSKQSEKPVLSPEEQALNKYSAKIYAKEVGKEILKQDKKDKLDEEALDMAVSVDPRITDVLSTKGSL